MLDSFFIVAPKIDRRTLQSITVREGEPIFVEAKITGEPAPTVTWNHDNKSMQDSREKRVENIPYHTKYINNHPERKDTGIYKITAQNKYGSDVAEVEITVICKYDIELVMVGSNFRCKQQQKRN